MEVTLDDTNQRRRRTTWGVVVEKTLTFGGEDEEKG